MSDSQLAELLRRYPTLQPSDRAQARYAIRRLGGTLDYDAGIPQLVYVLGDDKYAAVRDNLVRSSDAMQPFIEGKPRPLTFRESILAKLESDDVVWQSYLDTCTGVAYAPNRDEFKIVPMSWDLLNYNGAYGVSDLRVDFESLEGVVVRRSEALYNAPLTFDQAINHKGWLAALEQDEKLLVWYATRVFSRKGRRDMGFWIQEGDAYAREAICPLSASDETDGFDAFGIRTLNGLTRFAQIGPKM